MLPSKRMGVSKGRSSRKFNRSAGKTKAINMMLRPMRGGWRL